MTFNSYSMSPAMSDTWLPIYYCSTMIIPRSTEISVDMAIFSYARVYLLKPLLLGRVALGAQRPIVVKLSRGRSVGVCVGRSVGLSVCLAHCGKAAIYPDAVWHHRLDGSRDEAGSGVRRSVHGNGYFLGQIWGAPLQPMGTYFRSDAALFSNYFRQTCCWSCRNFAMTFGLR